MRTSLFVDGYFEASYHRTQRNEDSLMPSSTNQIPKTPFVDPVIEAYKKDIDITLIRENLRLTVDQRFQQLMKLQRFAEELQLAGRAVRKK